MCVQDTLEFMAEPLEAEEELPLPPRLQRSNYVEIEEPSDLRRRHKEYGLNGGEIELLRQEVVAQLQLKHGVAHPLAVAAMQQRAISTVSCGCQADARKMYRRLLSLQMKTLGHSHLDTVTAMRYLARLLSGGPKRHTDEAASLCIVLAEVSKQEYGAAVRACSPCCQIRVVRHISFVRSVLQSTCGNHVVF